jgi:probable HAF family extracellular repeat protein
MKPRTLTCFTVITLLTALVIPLGLAAQAQQQNKHHFRYKLIDLGTFGGPTGWLCNDPSGGGGACGILNGRGQIASGADTSLPNPNYLNSNVLLPPGNSPIGDPFIQHAFRWQDGVLQDLGTLPGGYNSFAQSISGNGLVVGLSENGDIDPFFGLPAVHAVLWQNHGQGVTDLGTLEGGYESTAFSVNDRAQVVGFALNTIPDPFLFGEQVRAFLWQKGVMQDLGTLGTGTDAFAYFINARGQVAGSSFTNTIVNPVTGIPTQDPFLWENGTMLDLGTLGGTFGFPNDLNNRGQVVGQSNLAGDLASRPFLWDKRNNPPLTDLGSLGGTYAGAEWINNAGEIVGYSNPPSDMGFHPFLWKNGVMTDLGTIGSDPCSSPLGINSRSQVVGFSGDCVSNGHAWLWENGQIIDLNIFNHPSSGLDKLLLAYNINDGGEIDGLGVPPGVNPADVFTLGHVFVLIPCDDNHPSVEGCDYTPVNATTVAQTQPTARQTSGPRESSILPQQTSRYRQNASPRNIGSGSAGDLDGIMSLSRRPPPVGYCLINTANNTLTGECIAAGANLTCIIQQDNAQCPHGRKPRAPTNFSCAIGQVSRVDAARSCQTH